MTKLKRTNLSEQAYRLLTERILSGEYAAGTRLTEETLAEEFGVSRTPLREALRRLTAEGLIEPLARRGLRVTSPDNAEIAELFLCRSLIEPRVLIDSLPRIPKEEILALLDRLESATPEESLAVDEAMHRLAATYCGNRFLKEIIVNLIRRSAPFRTIRTYAAPEIPKAERAELLRVMMTSPTRRNFATKWLFFLKTPASKSGSAGIIRISIS